MQDTQQIKESDIKMQGRMTVEEIQAAMEAYDGKSAPCDHKYKSYTRVEVPKINLYEFLSDLKDILNAIKVGSQDVR